MQKENVHAMSKRRRAIIFASAALLVVFAFCLDNYRADTTGQGRRRSPVLAAASDSKKYHGNSFNVIKVVDGDTIDIDVADGGKSFTRIRLWGVDTPETKKPGRRRKTFVFANIGQFVPWKKQILFLEAAAKIADRIPDSEFL